MFGVGDFVSSNKGVCRVEKISTLDISGVDKNEKYYILKPVYSQASTVYVPVETADDSLRPILTKKEAEKIVKQIPDIPMIDIVNEKLLEQEYKDCIRSNDARELVSLLKTLYKRRQARLAMGRKETALDAKYHKMASEYFFGELAISLDMPRTEVESFIDGCGWEGK